MLSKFWTGSISNFILYSVHGAGIPQDNNIEISDSDSDSDFALLPISPIPGLTSSYTKYESAPTSVSFSRGFVSALTVNQCIALDVPTILPAGSVHVVGWSKVIPDDTLFIVGDGIPCLSDIRKFIGDQTTQFAAGFRSVVLEISGLCTPWC